MPTWTSNIPSQVKTFANLAAFPATGSVKTIYIAEDNDIAYYWTGSAYVALSIQDLSGLVPYTGATQDVDLGANGLDAKFVNVKGTGGAGHLGLKHQSSNATAGGQETVIFAGNDGEPRFKNDGNAVEQIASREWVGLQGFITNVVTALGYTPVPNTRTVNGYDLTANRTLTASDVGAVATNSPITGATKTKITFDAKGLVTSGADATTADISDSSNKRYVTDAQQTILNKTLLNDKLIAGSSINVTAESILGTFTINANTLSANDVIKIMASTIKVGTAGTHTLRIRHNTSNTLVGATQIAIVSVTNTANINVTFSRQNLIVTGGNLTTSFPFGNSSLTDINSQLTTAPSSTAFDVTVTNYFFITVVLASASDSISLRFATIQNF